MSRPRYTHYPRTILWLVPGGALKKGGGGEDEQPAFQCDVAPFYISKWPITNEQYEAFDPGYVRSPLSPADRGSAVGISYEAADAYARWYADVSRKQMRLPTEIEWEYACRGEAAATTSSRYFWGDDPARGDDFVWDRETADGVVQPADAKRANGFGLHSMLGGVWEWTSSPHSPSPKEPNPLARVPNANDARERVLRGGSFRTPRKELSCAGRRYALLHEEHDDVGFRIVRSFGA